MSPSLRQPGTKPSRLRPRDRVRCCRESEQLVLKGSGGRFPPLASILPPRESLATAWVVVSGISDSDLQANCTCAVTLCIHMLSSIQEVLIAGGARDTQLVKFMMYDVYRQLMVVPIVHEELDDCVEYDHGSLGGIL